MRAGVGRGTVGGALLHDVQDSPARVDGEDEVQLFVPTVGRKAGSANNVEQVSSPVPERVAPDPLRARDFGAARLGLREPASKPLGCLAARSEVGLDKVVVCVPHLLTIELD